MAVLVKTINGIAYASVKTRNGIAVASLKTINGIDVTSGGGGGYSFLVAAQAGSSNGNSVTTSSINTSGAGLVVIAVSSYSVNPSPSPTDSAGNTWTALTERTDGISRIRLFYCFSPTTSSAHTFSASQSASFPAIAVCAFSGTGSYNAENGGVQSGSNIPSGSVTPSANNALLVTGCIFNGSGASVSISTFTEAAEAAPGGGTNFGCAIGYYVQPTAAAITATWAGSSLDSSGAAAAIAAFIP